MQYWLRKWIREIKRELDIKPIVRLEETSRSECNRNRYVGWASGRTVVVNVYPGISRNEIRWVLAHELRHVWQDTKYRRNSLWKERDRNRLINILIDYERRRDKKVTSFYRRAKRKKAYYLELVLDKYHDVLPEEVDAIIYANSKVKRSGRRRW